jgi:hypothetical protein
VKEGKRRRIGDGEEEEGEAKEEGKEEDGELEEEE